MYITNYGTLAVIYVLYTIFTEACSIHISGAFTGHDHFPARFKNRHNSNVNVNLILICAR